MSATFVQSVQGNTGTAATSTLVMGTCTVGDIIILAFGYSATGGHAPSAVSDSAGNTWFTMWGAGGNTPLTFWGSTNIKAGTTTITASGGTGNAWIAAEYQPVGNVQFYQELPALFVSDNLTSYWLTQSIGTLSSPSAVTLVSFVLATATASIAFSVSTGATIRGTATYGATLGMCLSDYTVTTPTYAQDYSITIGSVTTNTMYNGLFSFTTYPSSNGIIKQNWDGGFIG